MKCLVTGGCGFIGSNLVDALLKRGDEVYVIDNLSTGEVKNIAHNLSNPKFHNIVDDITNREALEDTIKEVDVIFHLAAMVGVKYIVASPLQAVITNVGGTENVFSLAYKYWRKVILASSSEVYGKNIKVPLKEDDERILGPTKINRWSYSASKAIDEHIAFAYSEKKLPVVILRFFNSYGPRINENAYGTVVAQFIKQALKNEPITVHDRGKQTRCFTYVDDTVEGIISAGDLDVACGEVFNIGNDKETSILELARLIKKICNSKSEIIFTSYFDYYGQSYEDTPRRIPDISKAKKILKFNPKINLEEGLKKTIKWCRGNYFKEEKSCFPKSHQEQF
jgi:UDP-glucose 4-epimerase